MAGPGGRMMAGGGPDQRSLDFKGVRDVRVGRLVRVRAKLSAEAVGVRLERAEGTLEAVGLPLEAAGPEGSRPDAGPDVETEAGTIDASGFDTVGTGSLTLSFMRTGVNVRIDPADHILEVAQRAGVRIGANCKEGMCGSCKVVKLSGEVEMNHQGGIRAREIDAGKFLPCCSTARTDMVIDA